MAVESRTIRQGRYRHGSARQGEGQARHGQGRLRRCAVTATVEGVNVVKRHTEARAAASGNMGKRCRRGGIIEKEAPLPLSALQYVCEKCKAPTRLRRGRTADGAAHRICARCGEPARESAKGA